MNFINCCLPPVNPKYPHKCLHYSPLQTITSYAEKRISNNVLMPYEQFDGKMKRVERTPLKDINVYSWQILAKLTVWPGTVVIKRFNSQWYTLCREQTHGCFKKFAEIAQSETQLSVVAKSLLEYYSNSVLSEVAARHKVTYIKQTHELSIEKSRSSDY